MGVSILSPRQRNPHPALRDKSVRRHKQRLCTTGDSRSTSLDRIQFEEPQKRCRRRRERTAAIENEIELSRELQTTDRQGSQFSRVELRLNREPGEEGNPEAAFDSVLDSRVAPQLESDVQLRQRCAGTREARFQRTARDPSPTPG